MPASVQAMPQLAGGGLEDHGQSGHRWLLP